MSTSQDTKENTDAIRELTKEVNGLNLKCEILNERLATLQKLVYGVMTLILAAVVTAILKTIGL